MHCAKVAQSRILSRLTSRQTSEWLLYGCTEPTFEESASSFLRFIDYSWAFPVKIISVTRPSWIYPVYTLRTALNSLQVSYCKIIAMGHCNDHSELKEAFACCWGCWNAKSGMSATVSNYHYNYSWTVELLSSPPTKSPFNRLTCDLWHYARTRPVWEE